MKKHLTSPDGDEAFNKPTLNELNVNEIERLLNIAQTSTEK